MANRAYILINVEPAKTRAVFDQLSHIRGAMVDELLGPYDIVVDLEAATPVELTAVLRDEIRPIRGITNTLTCVCLKDR